MNERFKFRCGITISHYDDDGNDIETLLLVNNVSIYDDSEVGFCGYFLSAALDRANLSSEKRRTLFNSLKEYEVFDEWYQMPADFIEQCTGLKDNNGNLIYEGDILKTLDGSICYVIWMETSFWLKSPGSEAKDWEYNSFYEHCEIIGNIHENKELLNER